MPKGLLGGNLCARAVYAANLYSGDVGAKRQGRRVGYSQGGGLHFGQFRTIILSSRKNISIWVLTTSSFMRRALTSARSSKATGETFSEIAQTNSGAIEIGGVIRVRRQE